MWAVEMWVVAWMLVLCACACVSLRVCLFIICFCWIWFLSCIAAWIALFVVWFFVRCWFGCKTPWQMRFQLLFRFLTRVVCCVVMRSFLFASGFLKYVFCSQFCFDLYRCVMAVCICHCRCQNSHRFQFRILKCLHLCRLHVVYVESILDVTTSHIRALLRSLRWWILCMDGLCVMLSSFARRSVLITFNLFLFNIYNAIVILC